ncbi:MAG: S9 family peptidase [Acidobacteria bacterium]|nr:S9 family peptidase [Acidobacteriota bacterium]
MPRRSLLSMAAILTTAASLAFAAGRPLTIDDALGIKRAAGAAISPDGGWVIYTVQQWDPASKDKDSKKPGKMEQHSHLWRVSARSPVGEGAPHQITFGEKGESSPAFSPDGKWISFIAQRGAAAAGAGADSGPKAQVYVMRTDGGEAWQLTEAKEAVNAYAWSPDSTQIAYTTRQPLEKELEDAHQRGDDPQVFEGDFRLTGIGIVNLTTRKAEGVAVGNDFTVEGTPSWSPDGKRLTFAAKPTPMIRDYRSQVYVATLGQGVEKITDSGPNQSPAFSPDGSMIAYLNSRAGRTNGDGIPSQDIGNEHLRIYDVRTRQTRDVSKEFDLSPGAPIWTDNGHILFRVAHRVYGDAFMFDLGSGQYRQLTHNQLLSISGNGALTRDGGAIAFASSSTLGPADIYVSDAKFTSSRKLTDTNPQLAEFALGTEEAITWKSSDGQEVEGLLLKPVNYTPGQRYPLLVNVHGGPTGAFQADFNAEGQFWAGKGWAVLYPNPRGSTNYGEKFMRANINDWGGGDFRDIMSGVDAVIARGIADPDRVAEWGWSYGGYMTCWIVTQTSRFKAAMMGAGLSDLPSMYGTTDIPGYIATFFNGTLNKDTLSLYAQHSGITYVDNVKTPLLILQGAQDERVPTSQSMEFYRALKDRGKTTQLVYYPREGHGFREYYHQYDRMKRTYEWISKYTLGEPPATAASPGASPGER